LLTVSRYFRDRIDAIVLETGLDVSTAFEAPDDDDIVVVAVPRAGDTIPWSAAPVMWPSMLAMLPELPRELEYRFLGRHLILIDVLANVVVDVLHEALPAPDTSSS
jgi:polyphosphate kinase